MPQDNPLGSMPIAPLLGRMAVPATIAMGTTALYNIVDTIFIGRWVGTLGIAGVSVSFPVQMIVLAVALLVGLGSASVISRALGEQRPDRAIRVLGTAVLMILGLSGILTAIGLLLLEPLMSLFGATPEIAPHTRDYLVVVIPGTFFVTASIAATHIVRSEGAAARSMRIMLIGAGVNIVLDPIFIYVLDMGVQGAAIATVIAQAAATVYGIAFFISGRSALRIRVQDIRWHGTEAVDILAIGMPAFVRQLAGSVIIVLINNVLAVYGGVSIAAFGIVHRVMIFSLMPLLGIGQGFQPIVGFNYGARDFGRVREAVQVTRRVSFVVALVPFVLVMSIAPSIAGLFSTDPELISLTSRAMRIALVLVPCIGLQVVGAIFFQAIGKSGPALVLSLSRQVLFLIPAVVVLAHFYGRSGVWMAFPVADALSFTVTGLWMRAELGRLPDTTIPLKPNETTA